MYIIVPLFLACNNLILISENPFLFHSLVGSRIQYCIPQSKLISLTSSPKKWIRNKTDDTHSLKLTAKALKTRKLHPPPDWFSGSMGGDFRIFSVQRFKWLKSRVVTAVWYEPKALKRLKIPLETGEVGGEKGWCWCFSLTTRWVFCHDRYKWSYWAPLFHPTYRGPTLQLKIFDFCFCLNVVVSASRVVSSWFKMLENWEILFLVVNDLILI